MNPTHSRASAFDPRQSGADRIQGSRSSIAWSVAFLLTCAAGSVSAAAGPDAQALLSRGRDQLSSGRFSKALSTLREADKAAEGTSAEIAVAVATAAAGAERWSLVEEFGQKALSLSPEGDLSARAHHLLGLGVLRGGDGDPAEARRHLEIALAAGVATSPSVAELLAECAERAGDLDEAARLIGTAYAEEKGRKATLVEYRLAEQMGAMGYLAACLKGIPEPRWAHPLVLSSLASGEFEGPAEGVDSPERTNFGPSSYLRESAALRIKGEVAVIALIPTNGRVLCPATTARVREDMAAIALAEISSWEFLPARLKGEAVPTLYVLSLRFNPAR